MSSWVKKVDLPTGVAFTGDMLEKAISGKIPVRVGINGGSGSSRKIIKGKTDRQPLIRGSMAGIK